MYVVPGQRGIFRMERGRRIVYYTDRINGLSPGGLVCGGEDGNVMGRAERSAAEPRRGLAGLGGRWAGQRQRWDRFISQATQAAAIGDYLALLAQAHSQASTHSPGWAAVGLKASCLPRALTQKAAAGTDSTPRRMP
jgi:hypothetical protein